ncbi:hypothetical protein [uncultured Campylobacter sp.]|uniref:hypothetical protein n=1 Tax=uncultured Campylobacter sp. TaxID=218934 RepID=UPI00262C8564|nr:hypothetical protein [uncultured Campylobacter sp.]
MFNEEKAAVTTLTDKVKELIKKYEDSLIENERLRTEITAIKAQNEALSVELAKMEEDIVMKNLTEEDLFKEIESVLAK